MNRKLLGKQNKEAGDYFEELLTLACQFYLEKGVASIEKTPEPMHVIQNNKNGTMTAIFLKKAQPDFKGCLEGGKCIIFEAKHTSGTSISRAVISDRQEETLNIYEKMGALTYVIVSFSHQNFYRIPWNIFRDMKSLYGRKSLKEKDLAQYKLRKLRNTILILDGIHYRI